MSDYDNADNKKELCITVQGIDLLFIRIPAGEFMMGSLDTSRNSNFDEHPRHCVRISKSFWIGKYPITIEQWKSISDIKPYKGRDYAGISPDSPVSHISWDDAHFFSQKLSKETGHVFRLPSEAEWEYCARSGSERRFYWGDDDSDAEIDKYAWYYYNTGDRGMKYPREVGRKQPNSFGLYDMIGNVWEWCSDWYYSDYYRDSPLYDPKGPSIGKRKVLRGGSWGDAPRYLGCSIRDSYFPYKRWYLNGFRLLLQI